MLTLFRVLLEYSETRNGAWQTMVSKGLGLIMCQSVKVTIFSFGG